MTEARNRAASAPSFLATLLAEPPAVPPPPSGSIRTHRLDDVKSGRPGLSPSFTAADKALIRRVHGYMSQLQLLGILNERLVCDVGDAATLYTLDQLKAEIDSLTTAVPAGGNDWGTLRKRLVKARRDGVLDLIDEQVINDFAVVYSLSASQMMLLKDVLLNGEDE